MTKQGVKIIILFVLITTICISGWHMYTRLEHNKQSFSVDMYDYVPAQATEVINVSRRYNLNELFIYNSSFFDLVELLGDKFSFPLIFSKYKNGETLLITKVTKIEEESIKANIEKHVALPYPADKRNYKDSKIIIYGLPHDQFLVCTFHKGMFAASFRYKIIANFIDADSENSFFKDQNNEEIVTNIRRTSPISIFTNMSNTKLAMEYSVKKDTIRLNGYIVDKEKLESLPIEPKVLPYLTSFSDNICIDNYTISDKDNLPEVEIILNKIY